ncbi:hypothetical protein [Microlunatus ginsengisoli]
MVRPAALAEPEGDAGAPVGGALDAAALGEAAGPLGAGVHAVAKPTRQSATAAASAGPRSRIGRIEQDNLDT